MCNDYVKLLIEHTTSMTPRVIPDTRYLLAEENLVSSKGGVAIA